MTSKRPASDYCPQRQVTLQIEGASRGCFSLDELELHLTKDMLVRLQRFVFVADKEVGGLLIETLGLTLP